MVWSRIGAHLLLLVLLVAPFLIHASELKHKATSAHPTKLTGFGSRSVTASTIIQPQSDLAPPTELNSTSLSVQLQDDVLWLQYQVNATENGTIFLRFSLDQKGSWLLEHPKGKSTIDVNSKGWVPIEGIYGVFPLPSGLLWVVVTSSQPVWSGEPWGDMRRVQSMKLLLVPATTTVPPRQAREQMRQLQLLRQALKSHELYYIVGGDMTQTLQRRFSVIGGNVTALPGKENSSFWQPAPDSRFFWNEPAVQPILERLNDDYAILLKHTLILTSAFVGIQCNVSLIDKVTYDEILISRRSRFRAGTRFTKRGADAVGAVANYAETEQVCLVVLPANETTKTTVFSHVQTRGSIPLRWSSPADVKTYRPRVRIGTDPVAQARAVQNHVLTEWKHYVSPTGLPWRQPKFVLVNLVDKKKDQGRLGRAFDAVLQAVLEVHENQTSMIRPDTVQHVWYDFHAEVKHGRWEKLSKLLQKIAPILNDHGYFKATLKKEADEWNVDRLQNGIVRTNCMDCLDRTNVVQSIFGRYVLFNELNGFASTDVKRCNIIPLEYAAVFRRTALSLPWQSGEVAHRLVWADNADAISRLYAGTPALKGDFTRTGKRTRKGALDDGMNSLQRYYLNNFIDADRQEGMDLMTGYASFTILQEGEEPADDAASRYARLAHSDVSLAQAARAMMISPEDVGDEISEDSFVHIKRRRRNRLVGGPRLDLRWLPGDLQCHVRAASSRSSLSLQALDRRTASEIPWWVVPDTSDDEELVNNNASPLHPSMSAGHWIGGAIAATQAPLTTALTVVLVLGWSSLTQTDDGNDDLSRK